MRVQLHRCIRFQAARAWRIVAALAAATFALGCAAKPAPCPPGLALAQRHELYFGLSIPGGAAVSASDWTVFLDDAVTPRFPDGVTVLEGEGRWRGGDGAIVEEPSRVLVILTDNENEGARIDEIRALYKQRFLQESVLRMETDVCSEF
jgi:hypothetical protein